MTLCLCRTVSEIFSVKEWCDLKTGCRDRLKPRPSCLACALSRGIDSLGRTLTSLNPSTSSCLVSFSMPVWRLKNVQDVVRGCHFHTRALRHIRPLLTLDAAKTFAVAIVSSRLDYCNSLLQGTSDANLDRLQRVQDVLARVVAQAPWSVSSTDLCRDFHWLPIRQRIVYKQCLMTYKAVHIGQPNYLNELIQPYQPVRTLRSSTSALLVIPFVRSDFVRSDAFSVSAPTLWNNLPQDVRLCANQATFKSRLKSHLFCLAFTV